MTPNVETARTDESVFVLQAPDGQLRLYALEGDRPNCIGTFADPAAAWAALDEIDSPA